MAELLAAVQAELSTDFAILTLRQSRLGPGSELHTFSYAVSAPGVVTMTTGNKYSDLLVRVERWDAHPPQPEDCWEDWDELPWQTLPDGGPANFAIWADEDTSGELFLHGLDRARVQVLATGRHRYQYGDSNEGLPRERWLVRFWPDPHGLDAMAGPPRRIAGPQNYERTPWQAALHSWSRTGWQGELNSVRAFYEIHSAIGRLTAPFAPDDLLPLFGPWGAERDRDGPYTWASVCDWMLNEQAHAPGMQYALDRLAHLAQAAGMESLTTFADMLECVERLGLLTRCHAHLGGLLTPNPAPRPIWEVLPFEERHGHAKQAQAMAADHLNVAQELEHFLRWAPDGILRSTARTIAVRLSRSATEVLGGIRLLDHSSNGRLLSGIAELGPDTPLDLHADPATAPG